MPASSVLKRRWPRSASATASGEHRLLKSPSSSKRDTARSARIAEALRVSARDVYLTGAAVLSTDVYLTKYGCAVQSTDVNSIPLIIVLICLFVNDSPRAEPSATASITPAGVLGAARR